MSFRYEFKYYDPPYPGQAQRHYANDPSGIPAREVDHKELIESAISGCDGWALSTSEPGIEIIKDLFPKRFFKDNRIRIGAWVKPFCSWKPTHRVQYTWEPILYVTPLTKGSKQVASVRDHLITPAKDNCVDCHMLDCCRQIPSQAVKANITMRRGTHGAKPDIFCEWILDLLGYDPIKDNIVDVFPGSGAFTNVVNKRKELCQQ